MIIQARLLNRLTNAMVAVSLLILMVGLLGCGKEELSRSKAEKIIYAMIQKDKPKLFCNYYFGSEQQVFKAQGNSSEEVLRAHQKLEQKGYVTIVRLPPEWGNSSPWAVKFTKKGLTSSDQKELEKEEPKILCAELQKVEVTGITESGDVMGVKLRGANFKAFYKPTAFGEELLKPDELTMEGQAPFTLYDDGWRLGM